MHWPIGNGHGELGAGLRRGSEVELAGFVMDFACEKGNGKDQGRLCAGVAHTCLWVATVVNNGQNISKITTYVQKSHLNKDYRGFL